MVPIRVRKLRKSFGAAVALHHVDLDVAPGELFFLLGPSGCGKTTLLRSIAGFALPDEGTIHFGEEDVTQTPPHRRHTGMMFQSYALWPHLTVAQNVAFGLEERRLPRDEIESRTRAALEAVRLGDLGARRPAQLSGGQQQRVALARALVIRPRCLLLDEPLSNLDAKLRLEMRTEIRRVCKEFNLTTLYVTHDQKEALSVADRMAVLDRGHILQVGTPAELYRRPHTQLVANFIGETNFIEGTVADSGGGRAAVDTPLGRFRGMLPGAPRVNPGSPVTVSIRPECWRLDPQRREWNCVPGRIGEAVYLGEVAQYAFLAGDRTLRIFELNPRHVGPAAQRPNLAAWVDEEDVVVLTA